MRLSREWSLWVLQDCKPSFLYSSRCMNYLALDRVECRVNAMYIKTKHVVGFLAVAMALPVIAEQEPSAEQMLRWVRINGAVQEGSMDGKLRRSDGKKVPFNLTMEKGGMSFAFENPKQVVALDLTGEDLAISESINGSAMKSVPMSRFGESIRGTDANFEDIALRFLFWPNPSFEKEPNGSKTVDRVATRESYKIRANNPYKSGPYGVVFAWVDKETGALMRVQGYDWNGKCIKQFEVISARKVDKAWMLKQLRVDRIDPASGKVVSRTWLNFDEAKKPSRSIF